MIIFITTCKNIISVSIEVYVSVSRFPSFQFRSKRIPSFQMAMKIHDDGELGSQGNGDGKVQSGEIIALAFKLVNKGRETVPELLLRIRGTEGSFRVNRGKLMLKNLEPDHEQTDYFLFKTLKNKIYEHGGTRTPDSQNRNLMLYPTELHAQQRVVIKKAK